ncbi:MAG TPA: DUF6266 family protein [Lentimicrobium sp.]|nr:DUF6266 family protein [Lentimicrobium sp.]
MAKGNPFKAKGRINNITMYTLNGENIMRIIPAHVYNPKTTGQTDHRTKIRVASKFLKTINEFIKIGYQDTSLDYPANEARQYVIKNCFNQTPDGPVLDYEKVLISRGEIAKPEGYKLTVEKDLVHIDWQTSPNDNVRRNDDRVKVVMYYFTDNDEKSQLINTPARRKDGTVTLSIPVHSSPVQVWMFFHNAEEKVGESRKNISDSVWLGEIK